MSAAETIRMAEANGIRFGIEGADLILDAENEPPVDVISAITRHKSEIIELLAASDHNWTIEDWRTFFDERAGDVEFDGGKTRADAQALAFECCVIEWMNRHFQPSNPDYCTWCQKPDRDGHAVVPFGIEDHGHTWLHPKCWPAWFAKQRLLSTEALVRIGIQPACRSP